MKTLLTKQLEHDIRMATRKIGVFGCAEVTIGFNGTERVDYMTYDTKGIFRCYEIKNSKSDFYSPAKVSFVGHYNYYVMPKSLYDEVKEDIPPGIGVYIGQTCEKRAKKQVLLVDEQILKDSLIRSLYRDSEKLLKTQDEEYLNRIKRENTRLKKDIQYEKQRYRHLYYEFYSRYGREVLREILDRET